MGSEGGREFACGERARRRKALWMALGFVVSLAFAGLIAADTAPAAPPSNPAAGSLFIPMDADTTANQASFNQNVGMWTAYFSPATFESLGLADAAAAAIPSAFLTVQDQSGANDVPGQQDLTQMGRDDTDPSVYRIFWSWDDTADWLSGGNTGDACALFDTTGDGRTDFEVCGQ